MDICELMRCALLVDECLKYNECHMGCPLYIRNKCVLVRIKEAPNDIELLKILHEPLYK